MRKYIDSKIICEVLGFGDFHLSLGSKPNPKLALDSATNPRLKAAVDLVLKPNPLV